MVNDPISLGLRVTCARNSRTGVYPSCTVDPEASNIVGGIVDSRAVPHEGHLRCRSIVGITRWPDATDNPCILNDDDHVKVVLELAA